jgi:hypothetical protein
MHRIRKLLHRLFGPPSTPLYVDVSKPPPSGRTGRDALAIAACGKGPDPAVCSTMGFRLREGIRL